MNEPYDDFAPDDELWEPDETDDDLFEPVFPPLKYDDYVSFCPHCKKPLTEGMDRCPYCGDIIFRHLKDGTFAPKKGPLAKFVAGLVIALIALGILAFILNTLRL